jgi:hypothetical protein
MSDLVWTLLWISYGIGAVRLLTVLPRWWRRPLREWSNVPTLWPFPHALFRGMVRAMGVGTALWLSVLLVLHPGVSVPIPHAFELVSAWIVIALIVVCFTIQLLNWPKFLVPPYLRGEPGALREWFQPPRAGARSR